MAKDKFAMSSIEKRVDDLSDWMTDRELRINVDKMSIDDLDRYYQQANEISEKITKLRQAFNQSIKAPMQHAQLELLGKAVLTKSPEELIQIQKRFASSQATVDRNSSSNESMNDDSQSEYNRDQNQAQF